MRLCLIAALVLSGCGAEPIKSDFTTKHPNALEEDMSEVLTEALIECDNLWCEFAGAQNELSRGLWTLTVAQLTGTDTEYFKALGEVRDTFGKLKRTSRTIEAKLTEVPAALYKQLRLNVKIQIDNFQFMEDQLRDFAASPPSKTAKRK